MTQTALCIIAGLIMFAGTTASPGEQRPVWPPAPDQPRVEFLQEIRCADLQLKSGFFGKIKKVLGGKADDMQIAYPFDILVQGNSLYMTCQDLPALVKVDLKKRTYQLFGGGRNQLQSPIALCATGDTVFMTDSQSGSVYRMIDEKLEPFITEGLNRPTGIAVTGNSRQLYVVDTGDHTIKVFDLTGGFLRTIGRRAEQESGLNYPTFAVGAPGGDILVNDALNFHIKRFDGNDQLTEVIGREGDGPGAFARPKGVAVDSRGHVYVVDNLFDNIQVFDRQGRVLLVIGSGGQQPGEFWSPGGIDIANDTIYVADTFNNRIQVLHYLGGGQ